MVKCNECKHFAGLNAINVNILIVKCNEWNILMVKCNQCKHFDG